LTLNIPYFKIYWDEEDIALVSEAIKKGMFWAIGPDIDKFEEMLAEYVGTKFALTFNSGTSALHAALLAHGIKKDDEVIVPSFTFISTANAARFVNAKPVFADIEENTYGLDPADVTERITPQTKAIMPMHYGGSACQASALRDIADDKGLILIEDAAESLGTTIDGRNVGTFGDSSIFSFCANKVISTGEGGCVVTDDAKLYNRFKLIRSHGREETENYFSSTEYMNYVQLGYNWRMSNITAALGISQLGKIEKIIDMRRERAQYMNEALSGIEGIKLPVFTAEQRHVYQLYTIRLEGGLEQREGLKRHLQDNGISSKVYFYPVHCTKYYKSLGYDIELPVTERVSDHILTLPMFPTLTTEEMDYITKNIKDYFMGNA
jgi:perosamine synthetase